MSFGVEVCLMEWLIIGAVVFGLGSVAIFSRRIKGIHILMKEEPAPIPLPVKAKRVRSNSQKELKD